jgi:voltage-gated potassium channel
LPAVQSISGTQNGKEQRAIQTILTTTLSRRSGGSPWRTLGVRAALAGGLLLAAFALLWFDRDGLKDQIDGHLTFGDVVYFTMITITTVGYGDIVPVSERARLIDAFLITPIRLFLWLIFLGTAFDMLFKRSWERWRMRQIQKKLNGHTVIAGFGRHGSAAAAELVAGGLDPSRLVVIDCKEESCAEARELGAAVLQGDASSDAMLKAVHIERAASLIVSAGRDDTSILIVLTARALAPKLPIAVTIATADNEDIAQHAGADQVINPIMVAARLLAQAARPAALTA